MKKLRQSQSLVRILFCVMIIAGLLGMPAQATTLSAQADMSAADLFDIDQRIDTAALSKQNARVVAKSQMT